MKSFVQKNITVDCNHHKFAMTQNTQKYVVGIVTFDLINNWFTSHQSHYYLQWYTRVYDETFYVNLKIAQTIQNSWNFIVRKSGLLKKWQTSVIIQKISYCNLETGRYGLKCGVSWIILESWQQSADSWRKLVTNGPIIFLCKLMILALKVQAIT